MSGLSGRQSLLLIPIAAAIVAFPLLVNGPSYGHDFYFHLLNWMEAARQFSHGTLYPRWAYGAAYNAGEPRFVFYPPLSWAIGALLGLILTHLPKISPQSAWTAVPIVYIWMCLTASGFALYRAARAFADTGAALAASILYIANPYMLFTAYERSAYAELLAAAWMPLLLLAILSKEVRPHRVALPVALLWLTNAPAAVIGCYVLVVLVVLRIASAQFQNPGSATFLRHVRGVALPAAAGTLLGIGVAAFYFIPAAWERRFVQVSMAVIVNMRIDQNFLFEHTGTSPEALMHDAVLRTASWVAVALLVAAGAALLACWIQQRRSSSVPKPGLLELPAKPLIGLTVILAFMLTGPSNLIWQHAPELLFLQFPWRLLLAVAPVFAFAAAAAFSRVRLRPAIAVATGCVAAMMTTALAYPRFRQVSEPEQSVASRLHAFEQNKGFDPTDEYTPKTADNDALTPRHPGYWLSSESAARSPSASQPAITPSHFTVTAASPQYLILNLRDYPAWRIEINGRIEKEREQRDDGLITLPVPAGTSRIDIAYQHSVDEIVGDLLTVASLIALYLLRRRKTV